MILLDIAFGFLAGYGLASFIEDSIDYRRKKADLESEIKRLEARIEARL